MPNSPELDVLRALFWDSDGVLVDTEHLYLAATRDVLARRGISLSDEQYHELFLLHSRGILHFAERHHWSDEALSRVRHERNSLYASLLQEHSCVLDGVEEVLSALHGRYAMGIVTSSQREHFDIVHTKSGLLKYFDFVLASGDYSEPKPHPEPYLRAVERAGARGKHATETRCGIIGCSHLTSGRRSACVQLPVIPRALPDER